MKNTQKTDKPKLLYIGNKLSIHGNSLTAVETLGELLASEFEVITVSDKKSKVLRLIDMIATIIRYRKWANYILIDTYSSANFYFALLCAVAAKYFNIPYIPILHGGNLPSRLQNNPKLAGVIFNNAFVSVAPSAYLLTAFQEYNYKVILIPNNIQLQDYLFTDRLKFSPNLLYVRAFSEVYNPKMAIYVLEKLLNKYPDAKLCMVGPDRDGMLAETKKLCKTLGLEGAVVFTGMLENHAWWALSKEYDIFLNTTNFDNTPVSVIEAMALGLPIISTNVGGIPYLIENGKNGVLVEPNDVIAMSEKIQCLLDNPTSTRAIAQKARTKAESFDWNQIKNNWIDLLKVNN